jgi:hypothetical protein
LSFVHRPLHASSPVAPRVHFFKGSRRWQTTHERTGLTVNFRCPLLELPSAKCARTA